MRKRFFSVIPVLLQAIIYVFALVVFKLFCRIRYEGVEQLLAFQKAQKAAGKTVALIFAPNHSSEWDGPLVRVGLPFFWRFSPMYYVSQKKDFYDASGWRRYLYGGILFNLAGAYPVYSGHHDYAYSLQNFIALAQRGRCVCIFPEGIRTANGKIGPARGGVAFLSHAAQAPVVPVAMKGLVNLTAADFFLRRRTVVIRYGTPMLPKEVVSPVSPTQAPQLGKGSVGPTVDDFHAGANKVMGRVGEML
ncbi:MAG: lysophospholipid acyltransferase family protein [Patescibacteria group bacterium]